MKSFAAIALGLVNLAFAQNLLIPEAPSATIEAVDDSEIKAYKNGFGMMVEEVSAGPDSNNSGYVVEKKITAPLLKFEEDPVQQVEYLKQLGKEAKEAKEAMA